METEVPSIYTDQKKLVTGLTEVVAALAITPIKRLFPGQLQEVPVLAESHEEVIRVARIYGQIAKVSTTEAGQVFSSLRVEFRGAELHVFHVG